MNEIKIIYKNEDFLCLNKPAGVLVHRMPYMKKSHEKDSEIVLTDWLLTNFPQIKNVGDDKENRPGIVHRLDRDTSGVMIVALNQEYFEYLKSLFANRKIEKTYIAVVIGEIRDKKGVIDVSIGIKKGSTKRTVFSNKMSKQAVTEFEKILSFEKDGGAYSFVKISPKTGRTHQIRVHFNYIHHPIVGDAIYGGRKNRELSDRLMLHSFSIKFEDKNGKIREFKSTPDEDFVKFFPEDIKNKILTFLKS